MHVRTGFVSNSSSSSFVCEVSDEIIVGYDASYQELNICECTNGHVFCDVYTIGEPDECDENDEPKFNRYGLPPTMCPICTLTHIRDRDIAKFIFNKYNYSRDAICAEMRLAKYDVNQ